jgi:hypothetical protein
VESGRGSGVFSASATETIVCFALQRVVKTTLTKMLKTHLRVSCTINLIKIIYVLIKHSIAQCFSQSAQRLHFGFANVNKVTLVGNVGQKPEIKRRTGEDGTERMYGNFSMATSETIRRSEGI